MPLSDISVRNAKPREKPYKLSDGAGLYVAVQPNGSRLWRLDYQIFGKRKTLSIGAYPVISLADARAKRDNAKRQIADGIDPSVDRKAQRIASAFASENTFASVVTDYLARIEHDGIAPATLRKKKWLLEDLPEPLAKRPIADIKPFEVFDLLQSVERTGRLETAVRLRSALSAVFRLAVVTLRAEGDPTQPLRGSTKSPKVRHRSAITDPKRLGAVLTLIDGYTGWWPVRCALQFTALTAARPGEVRCARWDEIDFKAKKWTIPAQRTKMRRQHEVPLSKQTISVLTDIKRLTGNYELVFASLQDHESPVSENAMNGALRRMKVEKAEHCSHGFRSSFSSILNERAEDWEIIEMCLAHVVGSGTRNAYNRAQRWDERTEMMQKWADLLDDFRKL